MATEMSYVTVCNCIAVVCFSFGVDPASPPPTLTFESSRRRIRFWVMILLFDFFFPFWFGN